MLVLVDRDGVLNVERPGYITRPEQLELLPGAAAAVARLRRAGNFVAVVTNQSAVGRGLVDLAGLERIHERLAGLLAAEGAALDGLFVCTDAPWAASERRKPEPGMLREAMAHFGAPPGDTCMIGDDLRDLVAAARAGCRRVLVRTGKGRGVEAAGVPAEVLPVDVCDDLAAAATVLLAGSGAAKTTLDAPTVRG